MTFELNGMEELNEQELMMVDGGKFRFRPKDIFGLAVGLSLMTIYPAGSAQYSIGLITTIISGNNAQKHQ